MSRESYIELSGLRLGDHDVDGNRAYTVILNQQGQRVGRFTTVGVGHTEHTRRLRAVVKRTIKNGRDRP